MSRTWASRRLGWLPIALLRGNAGISFEGGRLSFWQEPDITDLAGDDLIDFASGTESFGESPPQADIVF